MQRKIPEIATKPKNQSNEKPNTECYKSQRRQIPNATNTKGEYKHEPHTYIRNRRKRIWKEYKRACSKDPITLSVPT